MATKEYVYATYEFVASASDELSLRLDDRIEIIEKDELYGDGWWKGTNDNGQSGIFPKDYVYVAHREDSPHSSSSNPFKETDKDTPGLHTFIGAHSYDPTPMTHQTEELSPPPYTIRSMPNSIHTKRFDELVTAKQYAQAAIYAAESPNVCGDQVCLTPIPIYLCFNTVELSPHS